MEYHDDSAPMRKRISAFTFALEPGGGTVALYLFNTSALWNPIPSALWNPRSSAIMRRARDEIFDRYGGRNLHVFPAYVSTLDTLGLTIAHEFDLEYSGSGLDHSLQTGSPDAVARFLASLRGDGIVRYLADAACNAAFDTLKEALRPVHGGKCIALCHSHTRPDTTDPTLQVERVSDPASREVEYFGADDDPLTLLYSFERDVPDRTVPVLIRRLEPRAEPAEVARE